MGVILDPGNNSEDAGENADPKSTRRPATGLLVSVRNVSEARAALRGGASLIDVKEPANGSLGKADDAVIAEVLRAVEGCVPVSAALGEWKLREDFSGTKPVPGLSYVKFGLAGSAGPQWRSRLRDARIHIVDYYPGAKQVVAAYADWQKAAAPTVDEVCAYACEQKACVFLLDTYAKHPGGNLLDFLPIHKLLLLTQLCRGAGVRIALAGSLGPAEIGNLLFLRPDWIAVRGSACEGGRDGLVSEAKVRDLVELTSRAPCEN
jgi:uncharacterized protein (UPF0264 family)